MVVGSSAVCVLWGVVGSHGREVGRREGQDGRRWDGMMGRKGHGMLVRMENGRQGWKRDGRLVRRGHGRQERKGDHRQGMCGRGGGVASLFLVWETGRLHGEV